MTTLFGVAWENVVIGLLSGVLVAAFGKIHRKYVDWRIEKQFPIAGEYLTKFEDEENGKQITQSASATLTQNGKKVTGVTKSLGDSRVWTIQAEITDTGHLHGIYHSMDPHDKGIGNFFLYINYQRYMEGIWSGYDSVNKKITSGRYFFRPVMSGMTITNAVESDIPTISFIADSELGKDYLTEALLNDYQASKKKYVFQVARVRDEIVGFSISIISDKAEVKEYLRAEKLTNVFEFSKKIGVIKTVAIKSSFKGRGIGTALVKQSLTTLETVHNIRSFCSIAWKYDDKTSIEGILRSFDFIYVKEIKNYWLDDSVKNGYDCAVCGSPPCQCPAVIFTKSI